MGGDWHVPECLASLASLPLLRLLTSLEMDCSHPLPNTAALIAARKPHSRLGPCPLPVHPFHHFDYFDSQTFGEYHDNHANSEKIEGGGKRWWQGVSAAECIDGLRVSSCQWL